MRQITDPSDVDDPAMQRLLRQRFDQLAEYGCPISELGQWHLVQPGDDVTELLTNAIDGTIGEPSWEWVEHHGSFFEAVWILSDDGFGHVYLIPDNPGIDRALLTLCRRDATKPDGQPDD